MIVLALATLLCAETAVLARPDSVKVDLVADSLVYVTVLNDPPGFGISWTFSLAVDTGLPGGATPVPTRCLPIAPRLDYYLAMSDRGGFDHWCWCPELVTAMGGFGTLALTTVVWGSSDCCGVLRTVFILPGGQVHAGNYYVLTLETLELDDYRRDQYRYQGTL